MNFTLNGRTLKYEDDKFYIWCNSGIYEKNPKWKLINICNHNNGYNFINIGNKKYLLHRVLGYVFLGLNIEDEKQIIDHIDGNKQNNNIENLRIITQQQNCFNQKTKKGYFKNRDKFYARIKLDYKTINLGSYDTEEEARQAYLDAKQKYHLIE